MGTKFVKKLFTHCNSCGSNMTGTACDLILKIKEFEREHVVVRDRDQLSSKLDTLIAGGTEKLQFIADFDSTLTKSVVDGKPTAHSLEIFASTKSLSQDYRAGCKSLEQKYGPQVTKDKTVEELQHIYNQWWIDHELLVAGENVTPEHLNDAVDSVNTPLRDGCHEMLRLLSEHNVPVVVVSAGLGEVVNYTLRDFKLEIVANFIRWDGSGGILGFTKPTVSVYNKHNFPLPVEQDKENVILLGDSLGDCSMADNIPNIKTVLKIGFFNGEDREQLERYRYSYDIVLMNDQTMDVVNALLRLIISSS